MVMHNHDHNTTADEFVLVPPGESIPNNENDRSVSQAAGDSMISPEETEQEAVAPTPTVTVTDARLLGADKDRSGFVSADPSNGTVTSPNKQEKAEETSPPLQQEGTTAGTRMNGAPLDRNIEKVSSSSLEDQAGCVSTWLLSFLDPLLALGAKKTLTADDVGVPSRQDLAQETYQKIKAAWDEELEKTRKINQQRLDKYGGNVKDKEDASNIKLREPSIVYPLMSSFGYGTLAAAFVYYLVSVLLYFVPILILKDLVRFFEEGNGDFENWDGLVHPWVQVAGLGIIPLLSSALETRHQVLMAHSRVFLRSALSLLVYQKCLRVSPIGRAETSTGQVVNMMSNDINQMQKFLEVAGLTAVAPIQVIIAIILIYQQVGRATWVGVGYMFFLMPTTAVVVAIVKKARQQVIQYSDLRVRLMNELLTGIRIIKFYAWEQPFGKEVGKLRHEEIKALTKLSFVSALGFSFLVISAPIIQPILVFTAYAKLEGDVEPLSASTAFTTVALFNIMRFPFVFMPISLVQYVQCTIALKRIARYLLLPELCEYVKDELPPKLLLGDGNEGEQGNKGDDNDDDKFYSITIQNGSFGWTDPTAAGVLPQNHNDKKKDSENQVSDKGSAGTTHQDDIGSSDESLSSSSSPKVTCLSNLTCQLPAGKLIAVVGPVGSGKSSFLSAIMGEMEPMNDHSKIYIPRGGGRSKLSSSSEEEKDSSSFFMTYCAQTPWVINDTIQGNILFGRSMDKTRYQQVLLDCALTDDLKILESGDQTEIGERGINLSGGQKARVSLARALYSASTKGTTQIILMDDPLSAVDPHVCDHLFTHAIAMTHYNDDGVDVDDDETKKTKDHCSLPTRILVTHQVQILPKCDYILVLDNGRIQHQGTYEDLIRQGVDFQSTVRQQQPEDEKEGKDYHHHHPKEGDYSNDDTIHNDKDESQFMTETASPHHDILGKQAQEVLMTTTKTKTTPSDRKGTDGQESFQPPPITLSSNDNDPKDNTPTNNNNNNNNNNKLIQDEERVEGSVEGAAYLHYIRAGGIGIAIMILTVQAIGRGLEITSAFWLAAWADAAGDINNNDINNEEEDSMLLQDDDNDETSSTRTTSYYVGIYALFGILGITAVAIRGVLMAFHRLSASVKLHEDLTASILNAPISFFDVTPIGRILNRFAADMDKTDLELTHFLTRGIDAVFNVLGSICAIVVATKGIFLIPLIPLSILYFWAQQWFRHTSTALQRQTKIATSPIFADFSQTLSGTSTIRAYQIQSKFFDHAMNSFDTMNASYLLVQLVGYWLALRLDIMGGLIAAMIGMIALSTQFIPAGWLGLSLTYSMEITTYLKYVVQMVANIEGEMSSVERILYYSRHVHQEQSATMKPSKKKNDHNDNDDDDDDKDDEEQDITHHNDLESTGQQPDDDGSSNAASLSFHNVSMRYRNGPLVLKDLTFHVDKGERIGICGRTGSGKSSVMIALFRICELADGRILLDNDTTDIASMDLKELRSQLAIIPQDPVLFSNTIRFNLNPFGKENDDSKKKKKEKDSKEISKASKKDAADIHSDDTDKDVDAPLWKALEKVQMDQVVKSMKGGLDAMVSEGGENFSQGQRQLICIARALLRNPKILVMDEATASIDNETDALVQDMITQHFGSGRTTILTIAHRLNTILQSDRILVLDDGHVAELDTPQKLLQNPKSIFSQLVQKANREQAASTTGASSAAS